MRESAVIGEECVIGRGAYIDRGVVLGDRCKVQNAALIYAPAVIGDGVFIGPAVVLTNDVYPRAVSVDGSLKSASDWTAEGVCVDAGASIGARAVILAGVKIGRWALIAAGAVVVGDVAPHALVMGVPARQCGWVGRAGQPLRSDDNGLVCPATGERYEERAGALKGPL